jgi:hypothetical protein
MPKWRMVKKHPIRPHLLAWRKKLAKTQFWLANELQTSQSNVQRQERGDIGVDDQTFSDIAKAYGITVAELSVSPEDADKARALDRLLRAVKKMDAEGISALASFAELIKPAS